jgi:hypothetical protein
MAEVYGLWLYEIDERPRIYHVLNQFVFHGLTNVDSIRYTKTLSQPPRQIISI